MGILIIILILVGAGIAITFIIAISVIRAQSQAKKKAKKVLSNSIAYSPKEIKNIMGILAKTSNDMEAADLWRRLNERILQSVKHD